MKNQNMIEAIKQHSERMINAINSSKKIIRLSKEEFEYKPSIEDCMKTSESELNDYNCIICSSEISGLIENLELFNSPEGSSVYQTDIFKKIGSLGGKLSVYVDSYLPGKFALCLNEKELLDMNIELNCNVIVLSNIDAFYNKPSCVEGVPGLI